MAELQHSEWSASGFEQVMLCPGSKVLQAGLPNTSSEYAAEGTAAHQVLTWALKEHRPAAAYVGRVLHVEGYSFVVDDEMAGHVQTCADFVIKLAGEDGVILVDQKVHYHEYLGVPKGTGWGTADVIVLKGDLIIVVDFKYGRGVEVSAGAELTDQRGAVVDRHPNPQMALYALGALAAYNGLEGDFTRARLVISQPRLSSTPSEYELPVDALEAWGRSTARSAVATAQNALAFDDGPVEEFAGVFLRPGEKQCRFCRAKATCPALQDTVIDAVSGGAAEPGDFELVDDLPAIQRSPSENLGLALSKVDLIEDWCKAIRAEAERRLLAGESVPGFKVVQGKKGNRAWSDAAAAEKLLRETFRLPIEKAYDLKLISPTTAEKLFKGGDIGPRQWPKAQALITQSEGKPHVAPVSDPRPALTVKPVVDDFQDLTVAQQLA